MAVRLSKLLLALSKKLFLPEEKPLWIHKSQSQFLPGHMVVWHLEVASVRQVLGRARSYDQVET